MVGQARTVSQCSRLLAEPRVRISLKKQAEYAILPLRGIYSLATIIILDRFFIFA